MGENSDTKKDHCHDLKDFFLQEKPSDMLIILRQAEKSHASELCKLADTTYSHSVKVMNKMKRIGLVESEKRGRKKEYTLTQQGREIADSLLAIYKSIDGLEIPKKESKDDWNVKALRS